MAKRIQPDARLQLREIDIALAVCLIKRQKGFVVAALSRLHESKKGIRDTFIEHATFLIQTQTGNL